MIYIADTVKSDILKINNLLYMYKTTVYSLEGCYINSTQKFLKEDLIRKIFCLRKKRKRLQRKLDYLINGNGLQPTWNGYKESK